VRRRHRDVRRSWRRLLIGRDELVYESPHFGGCVGNCRAGGRIECNPEANRCLDCSGSFRGTEVRIECTLKFSALREEGLHPCEMPGTQLRHEVVKVRVHDGVSFGVSWRDTPRCVGEPAFGSLGSNAG
jgi:hypothetical protein